MEEIKSIQKKIDNKQPSNLEAEQALLGSILVNNDIIDEVSTIIKSTTFYDPGHVKIYEVIENLNNKNIVCILSGGNNDISRYPERSYQSTSPLCSLLDYGAFKK